MKIAAIILIIVLILIPLAVQFIFAIVLAIRNKEKSQTLTPNPQKAKKNRRLAFFASGIYFLILISAFVWAFILYSPGLNFQTKEIIFGVIFIFIWFFLLGVLVFFWWRYSNKVNPKPPDGSDIKTMLEWENRYSDLLLKNFGRLFLIMFGSILFLVGLVSGIMLLLSE
jgi:hypothetical protein